MADTIQLKLLESKSIVAEFNGRNYAYEGGYHIIAGEANATEFEITSIPLQYEDYEIQVSMINAQGDIISLGKEEIESNRKFKLPMQMAIAGYGSINIKAVQDNDVIPWLPLKIKIWNTDWKQSPIAPALIKIGRTETLPPDASAYVTNVGTDKYVILNLGIPRGEQGKQGEQGIPGVTSVIANPILDGGESDLTSVQIDGINYVIPTGGGSEYILPIATATTLGGVKPVAKTDTMTQEVGVNENGALYTKAPDLSAYYTSEQTDEKIAEAVGAIQTNTITVTENDDGTVDLTIE